MWLWVPWLVFACGGDDASAPDAGDGALDAGMDAPAPDTNPAGGLDGPAFPVVDEEACYRTGLFADSYEFFWGDGSSDTVPAAEACHRWTVPGSYAIGVRAGARSATRSITAVLRPAEQAPTRSSPIAYDAARDRIWAVTTDADQVVVVDATTRTRAALLETCDGPRTVAVRADEVAVICEDEDVVRRFDAVTFERRGDVVLPPGSRAYGLVANPDGSAYAASLRDAGRVVFFLDEITDEVAVDDPRALAWSDAGVLLVTRWRAQQNGASVYVLDVSGDPVLSREVLLPRQEGLDSDTDNSGVPSFLDAMAFTPDGFRVALGALKANVVTGLHRTGTELTSQTTARAVFVELLPGDRLDYEESSRFSFDDLDYASAIVSSAIGDRLYLSMMGAQRVVVLEAYTFDIVGSIANVGQGVRGLALDGGGHLWVHADLSRALHVYDVSELSAEPVRLASIATVDDEPLSPEVLQGKRLFHASADPRISRTSYLSCASCHLDAQSDGLTWDFTQRGEGLRNTVALRGRGGVAHGPVHWTGNFDEVQDFENDIRAGQGGTGLLSDADFTATMHPLGAPKAGRSADLDALAAYVSSLTTFGRSPVRGEDGFDVRRARGGEVFTAAGCADCHSGSRYTDSALDVRHDVGTAGLGSGARLGGALDGFDTPTLRGLWSSAPYLHDGSAATLRHVLTTRNAGDAHGSTSALTEPDLAALETFLLSLDDEAP